MIQLDSDDVFQATDGQPDALVHPIEMFGIVAAMQQQFAETKEGLEATEGRVMESLRKLTGEMLDRLGTDHPVVRREVVAAVMAAHENLEAELIHFIDPEPRFAAGA